MTHSRKWIARLGVFACMFAGLGCVETMPPGDGGGDGGGNEEAPDIPPAETFVINFDDFTEDADTNGEPTVRTTGVLPRANWLYSGGTVLVWNTILTVNLVIPVASFVESFNHQPTLKAGGIWSWEYDFMANGNSFSAELQGQINGGVVDWNMFITKDGEYTDFNWFSGQSSLMGTDGTWSLNRNPNDPSSFIDIEWNRNEAAGEADIRYENVIPDSADNGDYIYYGVNMESPYNAFYEIFRTNQGKLTQIEWNRETKAGRVKDEQNFGDEEYYCWDEFLVDTECPGGVEGPADELSP